MPEKPAARRSGQIRKSAGKLYFGDNLRILADFIGSESVDLIYLDPPFNSKRNYNITCKGDKAQERAFDDVWTWNQTEDELLARLLVRDSSGIKMAEVMEALSRLLEKGDMLSYLVNMAVRLREMRRVLKPTGSIYLHCDPTASHYLKIMMDVVFGPQNFRNEIIWKRTSAHNDSGQCGRIHDTILFYTKSDRYTWNRTYTPYSQEYVDSAFRFDDQDGRGRYCTSDLSAPAHGHDYGAWKGYAPPTGRMWSVPRTYAARAGIELPEDWRVALDVLAEQGFVYFGAKSPKYKRFLRYEPGLALQDIWTDIALGPGSRERQGYPTQKPQALLERIILASSNPGDLILDPFCGCGTTVAAASKIGDRRWIGIDIAKVAIDVIQERLASQGVTGFDVNGIPTDLFSAQYLAGKDKFAFERWAVKELGGYTPGSQIGDRGIDGKAHFLGNDGKSGTIIISVKGGSAVHPEAARDLLGTVHSSGAELGILIMLGEPSKRVREAANHSGIYQLNGKSYPVVQILPAENLVTGKLFNLPDIIKESAAPPR